MAGEEQPTTDTDKSTCRRYGRKTDYARCLNAKPVRGDFFLFFRFVVRLKLIIVWAHLRRETVVRFFAF